MKIKVLVLIYLLLFLPAACYSVRYDGPYEGKVIDAETRQPIEGVVVLGTWSRETPTAAGAVSSYYDAAETVTDKNGDFSIKGLGLLVVSNVIPMDVLIFKAGYEYIGMGPWDSFKEDEILQKKVKWEGNKAIISLKKLTMEERRKLITFPPYPDTEVQRENKAKHFMEEIYKERKERGLN